MPPTRSLTRARRALSELPGGGGTPLASGLQTGLQVAEAAAHGDVIARVGDQKITFHDLNTLLNSSAVVGLSIPALGTPERDTVRIALLDKFVDANLIYLDALKQDALSAARALRSRGVDGIVIDISPRPRPDAGEIAQAMDARYLPLPMADAAALERAVSAAQPEPQLVR